MIRVIEVLGDGRLVYDVADLDLNEQQTCSVV